MKTTFKQYIQEAALPKATSEMDLLNSINNGKFTKDGTNLRITHDFSCDCDNLKTLKGAPAEVGGYFSCNANSLTSLEGAPSSIGGTLFCNDIEKMKSLKDIHKHILKIGGGAHFRDVPIKMNILGLLKIKGLQYVIIDNKEVERIINKYLPEGDLFACQQELIDAGFEAFAQL